MYPKISIFLFLLILASCNNLQNPDSADIAKASMETLEIVKDLPELLDRGKAIQHGKEWDDVQNLYGKFRYQIIQNQKPEEAKLQMAQLFTQEARVTGEHGHYYPGALKLLNEISDSSTENKDLKFRILSTKAGVMLSQHEFSKALELAQEAVKLNPYNAQIYGILTDAYVEMGDYEKAVEMADKMISVRPDLRSYSRVSYLREIHGMVDEAIEAMQLAVQAGYPGYEETAWTILQLGQLYQRYGQLEKAKAQYLSILEERPNYPFAIAALADIEMVNQNYDQAEKLLNQACAIIPEVGFFEQLAHLYFETGRKEEGEKLIPEILAMLQDDIDSGHNMNLEYAAIYADLIKDYEEALEFVLTEYEKRPKNIDVNKILAELYFEKGNIGLTEDHLEKASVTNSKDPDLMKLERALNKF